MNRISSLIYAIVAYGATAETQSCGLCPGGAPMKFPDAIIGKETCADINARFSLIDNPEQCASEQFANILFQGPAFEVCGCDFSCTLCQDESSVVDPEIFVEAANSTCGELSFTAHFSPRETCPSFQIFSSACCRSGCTLCQDGSEIENPDVFVKEADKTCGELSSMALLSLPGICPWVQMHGPSCGCSFTPSEKSCTLCPDGSSAKDLNFFVKEVDATCGALEGVAPFYSGDSCADFHALGVNSCGCSYTAPQDACTLCLDGSPVKDRSLSTGHYTCEELEMNAAFLASGIENKNACSAYQSTAGKVCGCESPPEHACSLCSDGYELDYSKIIDENIDATFVCGEAQFEASADLEQCERIKAEVANTCCIPASDENNENPNTGLNKSEESVSSDENTDTNSGLSTSEDSKSLDQNLDKSTFENQSSGASNVLPVGFTIAIYAFSAIFVVIQL
mmetsp:Transcript_33590/g.49362  ORF Transcript_33590/g.49362 Transcript_33590/m.49362 type:complete len:453 (+) Transcript_33590:174-1532(+)|eukprot:CAMPEP_0195521504 /NCGR_PEP_ID=MMETSP0794_2-20130614/18824_1 /TAXON_ID=515487 /ORGANISM="Stephanopyxis turris, Strain CCMP 815" /LENGTH=452 /DNA_ID=CAMNT_0040651075 /DNA_START=167 /DNA_END=1525 /DNA_ORIENTATION=+